MRVLLVAPQPYFQPRGTPIDERLLVEALTRAGHEVTVLTFPGGDDPGVPGSTIRRIPRLPGIGPVRPGFSLGKLALDLVLLAALVRCCRRERWDVVHAVEEAGAMALLARRLCGVPYVYDCDSHLAEQLVGGRPLLRPVGALVDLVDRAALRGAQAVLAVCPALGERAAAAAPGVPVTVVEDCSLLASGMATGGAPASDAPRLGGAEPVALYVGNLARYQGVELLVRAFARAADVAPGRLAIVGGGRPRQMARLRALAAELGCGDRVDLLGPRPLHELGWLLAQATVLVSPRLEGLNTPMKVYSYLEAGKPILATRVIAHTQLLDDEAALLAEPRPGPLGDALALLLGDAALRERLASGAARLARKRLDPAAQEKALSDFYAAVERRLPPEPPRPSRRAGAGADASAPAAGMTAGGRALGR